MWVRTKENAGYSVAREHDNNVKAGDKAVEQCLESTGQDDVTNLYNDPKNYGDLAGRFYWHHDPGVTSGFAESAEQIEGEEFFEDVINVPSPSRKIVPSDFMTGIPKRDPQVIVKGRDQGAWMQGTVSVVTPEGVNPIWSKEGGIDRQIAPKELILEEFSDDEDISSRQVKCAIGKNPAFGTPGIVHQTLNQESNEQIFIPSGGLITVDHSTEFGLSTPVLGVREDGYLDIDDEEVASLNSKVRIARDENGAKVVVNNATKAGNDETGFDAHWITDGYEREKLAYGSIEKGGPFVAASQTSIRSRENGEVNAVVFPRNFNAQNGNNVQGDPAQNRFRNFGNSSDADSEQSNSIFANRFGTFGIQDTSNNNPNLDAFGRPIDRERDVFRFFGIRPRGSARTDEDVFGNKINQERNIFRGWGINPEINLIEGGSEGIIRNPGEPARGAAPFIAPNIAGDIGGLEGAALDEPGVVPLAISTEALFKQSPEREGPLAFSDGIFPNVTGDQNIQEAHLVWDSRSRVWRWIVQGEKTVITALARIRWNVVDGQDFSEGELVGNNFVGLGADAVVWIDYYSARSVFFNTAGDGAIYEVEMMIENGTRGNETRPVYKVNRCLFDDGTSITHFEVTERTNLYYRALSQEFSVRPWENSDQNVIKTTILGEQFENILPVRLPNIWETDSSADYRFLKATDFSRGLDLEGSPILAQAKNENFFEDGRMVSGAKINNFTIAEYQLIKDRSVGVHNALVRGINVDESKTFFPVDSFLTIPGDIVAYTPSTGRMQVVAKPWDRSENKLRFNVQARYQGRPGIPTADEVQIGQRCTIHRVGNFNSPGTSTATGYEVDEPSTSQTSWECFFFRRSSLFNPISILAHGPDVLSVDFVQGSVETSLPNPSGVGFVDLGIKRITSYTVTTKEGGPIIVRSVGNQRIIALDDDEAIFSYKGVVRDCDSPILQDEKVYNIKVAPGLINFDGVVEDCLVFAGIGDLVVDAICCEDEEGVVTDTEPTPGVIVEEGTLEPLDEPGGDVVGE